MIGCLHHSCSHHLAHLLRVPVPNPATAAGTIPCSLSTPQCRSAEKTCDLRAALPTSDSGVCRAAAACPACPAGFECVIAPFPGSLPWCRKVAACDPPCAAGESCYRPTDIDVYIAPYVSTRRRPPVWATIRVAGAGRAPSCGRCSPLRPPGVRDGSPLLAKAGKTDLLLLLSNKRLLPATRSRQAALLPPHHPLNTALYLCTLIHALIARPRPPAVQEDL